MPLASHLGKTILLAAVFLAGVPESLAGSYKWLSKFTEQSSKDLAALHAELLKPRLAGVAGVSVRGAHWKDEFLDLHLEDGTIWIEPPVQGYPALAFFSGKATMSFAPSCRVGRMDMEYWLGAPSLEKEPVTDVMFLTLKGGSLLDQLGATAAAPAPPLSSSEAYELSKLALGQMGIVLVKSFLNREGSSRGASFLVLTAPAIRTKSSKDALLMYRHDPESDPEVGLLEAGHSQVVETGPGRYMWWNLARCRLRQGAFRGPGRVEEYTIDVKTERAAESVKQQTELRFAPAAGVSAFTLFFTPQMKVLEVKGPDGASLPFLQWRYLPLDPNYDAQFLVSLRGTLPAGQTVSLQVRAAGTLFEPIGTARYIIDEDDWYPRMDGAQSAFYDVTITLPEDQVAVSAGKLVEDVRLEQEDKRRFRYRSTKPLQSTSLHYGPFETAVGKALETEVQVYGVKRSVQVRQNMDFIKAEMENTIKTFSRIYGPLEFPVLRVVGTPELHGRGFEGLLLLSQSGGLESTSSFADVFRAHEVAHQWWGNVVQPMNWPEDRWISESFAEYSAMEYYRIRYQDPRKTTERIYIEWIRPLIESFNRTVYTLKGEKSVHVASQISPLIDGGGNVYTKGPAVLHMLRYAFKTANGSDEGFWTLLRTFLEKHAYEQVATADFFAEAERALGEPIPWFWEQWVYGTDIPTVRWSHTVRQTETEGKFLLTVNAEQEGTAFNLLIPVFLTFKGDRLMTRPLSLRGAKGQLQLVLPEQPSKVSLNDSWEALVKVKKK